MKLALINSIAAFALAQIIPTSPPVAFPYKTYSTAWSAIVSDNPINTSGWTMTGLFTVSTDYINKWVTIQTKASSNSIFPKSQGLLMTWWTMTRREKGVWQLGSLKVRNDHLWIILHNKKTSCSNLAENRHFLGLIVNHDLLKRSFQLANIWTRYERKKSNLRWKKAKEGNVKSINALCCL